MNHPVRLGVIGLGRRWRKRYRPALIALRKRFTIAVVCDQRVSRAEREARLLHCGEATGPAALLERDDLDALFLCDPQWFGLWPLKLAARQKLPVFCTLPVLAHDPRAEEILGKLREAQVPIVVESTLTFTPASRRARELLASELGQPRLLLGESIGTRGTAPVELIHWCLTLLGTEPKEVHVDQAVNGERGGLFSMFMHWEDGRAAQVSALGSLHARHRLQARVVAQRGDVCLEFPNRLEWTTGNARQTQEIAPEPVGELLLEAFHASMGERGATLPSLGDVLGCLRVIQRLRDSVKK
jgi:predicted dehydrogenase